MGVVTTTAVACPLCRHDFDAAASVACKACPLAPGCGVICCPSCGYSWVLPERTTLGRWMKGWIGGGRRRRRQRCRRDDCQQVRTLAEVPPRGRARIHSCAWLPEDRRRRLRAYGLTDGGIVEVIQQSPATLIVLDQAEVALETDLARCILVEVVDRPEPEAPRPCALPHRG